MIDLAKMLNFRFMRAFRHWAGEQVTLQQVIEEAVTKRYSPSGAGGR